MASTAKWRSRQQKKKLYGDRLKSVLATKCHINNFLATMPFLCAAIVKKIIFPIIQIMGLNVHVLSLRLGNNGIYILQEVASFRFPTTALKIKDNMKEMIDGLALIEVKKKEKYNKMAVY